MAEPQRYPKRLIEVDLPIRKISEHARREKSIRHGHISTLHLWWARRPLAACRAVLCAALWPDPVDEHCPQAFREAAAKILCDFAEKVRTDREVLGLCGTHWPRWKSADPTTLRADDSATWPELRHALLDFIADFANWDAAGNRSFGEAARSLTRAAQTGFDRPVVLDPFAGGGSIPYEAARLGAETFASDLNPVAVILNTVVQELVPRFGSRLVEAFRLAGARVNERASVEIGSFYPSTADGPAAPAAYLWARTIRCEGPSCGGEVPLLRSLWLGKRPSRMVALKIVTDQARRQVDFQVIDARREKVGAGTTAGGRATCPICGFTTPNQSVRRQLVDRRGGAASARMILVVDTIPGENGRSYRLPNERDIAAAAHAAAELQRFAREGGAHSVIPDELIPNEAVWKNNPIRVHLYGMKTWGDLFHPRQALALSTLVRIARDVSSRIEDPALAAATRVCLGLAIDRVAEKCSSLARWDSSPTKETLAGTFGRQALPMVWDFAELVPFRDIAGSFANSIDWVASFLDTTIAAGIERGHAARASATAHPLPDDSVDAVVTDPPYYDAVPYAKLSNFFYVWLKRSIGDIFPDLFSSGLVDAETECVVDDAVGKDRKYFETTMASAMSEARRVLRPSGVGVVVFAHKSTVGWEAQLSAMIDAGWVVTGSWPIDTELPNRMRARDSAALASSVHLVCRPREHADGAPATDEIGDWRSILEELPRRIRAWLPRLAEEGVVGADAIFACLGPALEVFSRYSRVEKVSGERVELREYLEHVWAAVSREALAMIFDGAETTGLEPDARLTAMWLWTLAAGAAPAVEGDAGSGTDAAESDDDGSPASTSRAASTGFILEYDAARKIAQGLGANLEELPHVAVIDGENARLLPVIERTRYLFGKTEGVPTAKKAAKKKNQMTLFGDLEEAAETQGWGEAGTPNAGTTTLDRVHQAMLLFGSGRGEGMKRFLVEEGVGKQAQFWKLAQSLSALYPTGSDEKRWVDGVLARKKGLGFG